jgi:hypothetical protein
MAKLPKASQTWDTFRIHGDTNIDGVGHLLKALILMGAENVGYELITNIPVYKQNNGKKHEVSGLDFAMTWIKDHPKFEILELAKHFEANGRSNTTAYTTAKALTENGTLSKLGPKSYQLGGIKALPAPAKAPLPAPAAKPPKTRKKGKTPRYDISNRDLILRRIGTEDEFSVNALTELFEQHGRPRNSVSALLTKFAHEKLVSPLGEGRHRVLIKAKKEAAKLIEQQAENKETDDG